MLSFLADSLDTRNCRTLVALETSSQHCSHSKLAVNVGTADHLDWLIVPEMRDVSGLRLVPWPSEPWVEVGSPTAASKSRKGPQFFIEMSHCMQLVRCAPRQAAVGL